MQAICKLWQYQCELWQCHLCPRYLQNKNHLRQVLVLLSLLANLTGLAVLVLLLASFASHCYFLRHRVFWF